MNAAGFSTRKLTAVLLDEAGDEAARKEFTPTATNDFASLRFEVRPKKSGVSFYRLRVGTDTWIDGEGTESEEATLANNQRVIAVDRGEGPYRVLYVSGRPNWEFKFLNRAVVGDDQTGTAQATVGERAEELIPEYLCFAGLDGDAQDLSAPIQIDGYRHYNGDGDNPPGPADLDVGGIEPKVGPFAFQWPLQKGIGPFVDLTAEPRDLTFRYPGHPHGLDQVID